MVLMLMVLCPSLLKHITALHLTIAVSDNTVLELSCDYLVGGMCYCNFYIVSNIKNHIQFYRNSLQELKAQIGYIYTVQYCNKHSISQAICIC